MLGVGIGFLLTGWYGRIYQMFDIRTMPACPVTESYIEYVKNVLSGAEKEKVRSMQKKTDEKTKNLVWPGVVSHLDFKRNKVVTFDYPKIIASVCEFSIKNLDD
jgi:hypothetical protein